MFLKNKFEDFHIPCNLNFPAYFDIIITNEINIRVSNGY